MPDGSTVLIARYSIRPVGWRRSRRFSSHSLVGSSCTEPAPWMALPGCAGQVMVARWNLQSAVANGSAFSEYAVGVAHHELGERVAFELGPQVHARGTGEVVEAVAVLQVGELVLEDVVERRAQQAAEDEWCSRRGHRPTGRCRRDR